MTTGGPRSYWVGLAQPNGSILTGVHLADIGSAPSHSPAPWISSTLARVYYLNAGSEVRYLGPNGTTLPATMIAVKPDEMAGFSVSPDDKRIAVSIFRYTLETYPRTYVGMRMYVEDLRGGANHVEIFSSATVAEYPIGWVGGRLIVAVGSPWGLTGRPNPYDASEYHIVDPANGDRLANLCSNTRGPVGWIQPFGTMCSEWNGGPSFVRWDGSSFSGPAEAPNAIQLWRLAMSPDGTRAAIAGDPMQVVGGDAIHKLPVDAWNVVGWLDGRHIVYQKPLAGVISILDLETMTDSDVEYTANTYQGVFPVAVR
jgi:hypothetical protein